MSSFSTASESKYASQRASLISLSPNGLFWLSGGPSTSRMEAYEESRDARSLGSIDSAERERGDTDQVVSYE